METQLENPNGLYQKYYIQKIVPAKNKLQKAFYSRRDHRNYRLKPMDEGFEGFVLRFDGGGDPKHVEACRKAILIYANEIRDYIPQLSKDLIEKYS